MSDIAIHVEGLSKRYKIGARQEGYKTLRDTLSDAFVLPFRRMKERAEGKKLKRDVTNLGSSLSSCEGYFWALKDVNLDVMHGDVLGIIGPNGAGKTTLLKVLCRITEPTQGYAEVRGRIGSLLEVGTGFHPELTGRENIYLNGAILGMRRNEIERKFDEIVAFAGVEEFLDTPVKRYSSGMYVRLAFAVAAHLDPEILVVDEVLAVGDAAFQKKCLGKMGEVAGSGRTVLLVSHNMGAIKSLATRVIQLNKGAVSRIGEPEELVNGYLASSGTDGRDGFFDTTYVDSHRVHLQKYAGQIKLQSVRSKNTKRQMSDIYPEGSDIFLEIEISSFTTAEALELFIRVKSVDGQLVFTCFPGKRHMKISPGTYRAVVRFNLAPLLPGTYQGDIVLLSHFPQDNVSPAFQFQIVSDPNQGDDLRTVLWPSTSTTVQATHTAIGLIRVRSSWEDFQKVEHP